MTKRSRQEWKFLIEEHAASGQTLAEFSRDRRVKRATFIWWRKELRRTARQATKKAIEPQIIRRRQAVPAEDGFVVEPKARRSRQEWVRVISRWMESGDKAEVFADRHGLKVNTLRWWKSELFGKSRNRRTPSKPSAPPTRDSAIPMTVRLVDELALEPTMAAAELTKRLGGSYRAVLSELRELEELGIVFRTGKRPGAHWALG